MLTTAELVNLYTDSPWLKSIGFIEDTNKDYVLCGWLVITCESGNWSAYSVRSSHWHYLCGVNLRDEVTMLVAALKLTNQDPQCSPPPNSST